MYHYEWYNSLIFSHNLHFINIFSYTLSNCEEPFDIKTVPVAPVITNERKTSTSAELPGAKKTETKVTATRHDMFVEKFSAIPEIAQLGALFKSSQPAQLVSQAFNSKFHH